MNSFYGMSAAINPLGILPSTTSGVTLWNGETTASGKKVYVVDSLFAFFALSQAAPVTLSLSRMINIGQVVTPATGTPITPRGICGNVYAGLAVLNSGVTVVDDGWFPTGSSLNITAAANKSAMMESPVKRVVILPGYAFSFHGLVSDKQVASSLQLAISWHETTIEEARALQ